MKRKNEANWIDSQSRWQINVQAEGDRRTFVSSTAGRKGKIEAERKADAWMESHVTDENTKAEILLDAFCEDVKARTGPSTYEQNEKFIRLYIKPVIGKKRISRITAGDLQDIINWAYADRHLARKTLMGIRATIMAWLKWCRMHGKTTLFVEGLKIPSGARAKGRTILTPDALVTLFSKSETVYRGKQRQEPYIWAYRFAVVTGLRPGELIGLLRNNIEEKKYKITQAIDEDGRITKGKNENAIRTGELSETAVWILAQQQKQCAASGLLFSEYVFPDADGGFISEKRYYAHWKRYCEVNGITEGTKPYELRHTFVSVNDEMPEALKKMIMGHSKSMDTEGVYGHEKRGDRAKAACYIDASFAPYVQIK